MMESLETTSALLEIQYDTGCHFSLISLQLLPEDSYSLGNSSRINLMDFTGQGQLFNTTEVRLNLYNIMLKLDANLDSGSAYSFPHSSQVEGVHRSQRYFTLRQGFYSVGW